MSHFRYFAYGSNLLSARLRERTPSATRVAVAQLPGHALRWHKAGSDGSGKCDVVRVEDPAAQVHGVVYQIALQDKLQLDQAESLGVGYAEQTLQVHTAGGPLQVRLYVALRIDPACLPYDWYHALVLAGAQEHGLTADYVAQLRTVATRPDTDTDRAQRHRALIGMVR
jgi:hypothetical protein